MATYMAICTQELPPNTLQPTTAALPMASDASQHSLMLQPMVFLQATYDELETGVKYAWLMLMGNYRVYR